MRNYWALLPAVTVCVVLAGAYGVPTLISPQFTSTALALFRRDAAGAPEPLTQRQRRSRRWSAAVTLVAALGLAGLNVSLNREANGCYQVAKAWGADDSEHIDDPCQEKLFGAYFSDPTGKSIQDHPQPVATYQVVRGGHPGYLRWVQNRPIYDRTDLVVGAPFPCDKVKVTESDDTVTLVYDMSDPCPPRPRISLVSIDLDKPLGNRSVVTVDGRQVQRIDPDLPSWPTVLKALLTGG